MTRRTRQLQLRFHPTGGTRKRAGRRPKSERAGVSHAQRPQFAKAHPVHVTLRVARHVWSLRSRRSFSIVGRAIAKASRRFRVQIVEFSVQGNHMHLIVEAPSPEALSRAMQGFSVRVARGLNRMMSRRGRVLADRFHAHVLRTPREARNAIVYVRHNRAKHLAQIGKAVTKRYIDEYSSLARVVALPAATLWLVKQAAGPPGEHRKAP